MSELEQSINSQVDNPQRASPFFYLLAVLMTSQDCDSGIKYMASLVLKNTLRNHVVTYKASGGLEELNAVKRLLFTSILALPKPSESQKKLLKEAR